MTTMETTLGQQIELPAGAALEPVPATWLPLTAGDAAGGKELAAPEHEWPGSLFIFLTRMTAICMGVGAAGAGLGFVFGLLSGQTQIMGWTALAAVGLSIGCVVQGGLASQVRHFSRWGWWGAMAELSVATVTKVAAVAADPGSIVGLAFGIGIDLVWMNYFWSRRADFDIDLDL